jgi:hypothetical protein
MNKIINLIASAAVMTAIVSMVASQAKAQSIDDMVIDIKNDGDALETEIANTDLNGAGLVEGLINKVYFYEGHEYESKWEVSSRPCR